MAQPDSAPGTDESLPLSNNPAENATLSGTLLHLWPYIWPGDRIDLKMRVVWSMLLLLVAKLATLSVRAHLHKLEREGKAKQQVNSEQDGQSDYWMLI